MELENHETKQGNIALREENNRLLKVIKQLQDDNLELSKMRSHILSTLGTTETVVSPVSNFAKAAVATRSENKPMNRNKSDLSSKFPVLPAKKISNQCSLAFSGGDKKRVHNPGLTPERKAAIQPEVNSDGKYFFAITKDRLCPREFEDFLQNIKKYRTKEIDKVEAIENAKKLFGDENDDLFNMFKQLMIA